MDEISQEIPQLVTQSIQMDEIKRCCFCSLLGVKKFLINNFLTIGIFLSFLVGLQWPLPGDFLASLQCHNFPIIKIINICLIFFISGLTLRTSKIYEAYSKFPAFFYTMFSIHFLSPLICFFVLKFLNLPQNFFVSVVIFCTVPCTLTSGADLVKRVKGNYALAQMITIYSTLIGLLTIPFMLKIIFEYNQAKNIIYSLDLLVKLSLVILIPLIFGKYIRHFNRNIRKFTKKYKFQLAIISKVNLILLIWQTISQSQKSILNIKLMCIINLIILAISMHIVLLLLNYAVALLGRWAEAERRTIFILASQKTLPIAITIISFFGEGVEQGDLGVILLPCIIIYFFQLYIDQYIINRIIASDLQNNIINNNQSRNNQLGDVVVVPHRTPTPTPIPNPPQSQNQEWEVEQVRNIYENLSDSYFFKNNNNNHLPNNICNRDIYHNKENFTGEIQSFNNNNNNNNNNNLRENFYCIDFENESYSVDWQRSISQRGETTHTHTHSQTGNQTENLTEENLQYYNFESSKNDLNSIYNEIYYDQNEIQNDKKVTSFKSNCSFEIYENRLMQKVDNWLRTILSLEDEHENVQNNNVYENIDLNYEASGEMSEQEV